MCAAVVAIRRRRSNWTIWNKRSARRMRLLLLSPGFDESDRVAFGIFEDAERDVGHLCSGQDDFATQPFHLCERPGDIGGFDIERDPRPCAGVRLADKIG